jgi:3-oxoacyl-[acyl-carrier protein] reductase
MAGKKLAVVTGAARGIGRAIVLELLNQDRIVAALDVNAERLAELETILPPSQRDDCRTECVDITDTQKFTDTLNALASEHGAIAILVNNAGITRDRLLLQMTDEDFDNVIQVNLRAAFIATRVALRSMVRNKFGRIISLSSVAAVMGNAGQANYAASKAGLIGLTKSLAREVARKNITANCIAPGFIVTEMTDKLPQPVKDAAKQIIPMRRFGDVQDVAKAVAFFARDDAGYITGQVLCIDGGMAM